MDYPLVNHNMAGKGNPEPKLSEDDIPYWKWGGFSVAMFLKMKDFPWFSHVSLPKGMFQPLYYLMWVVKKTPRK